MEEEQSDCSHDVKYRCACLWKLETLLEGRVQRQSSELSIYIEHYAWDQTCEILMSLWKRCLRVVEANKYHRNIKHADWRQNAKAKCQRRMQTRICIRLGLC